MKVSPRMGCFEDESRPKEGEYLGMKVGPRRGGLEDKSSLKGTS